MLARLDGEVDAVEHDRVVRAAGAVDEVGGREGGAARERRVAGVGERLGAVRDLVEALLGGADADQSQRRFRERRGRLERAEREQDERAEPDGGEVAAGAELQDGGEGDAGGERGRGGAERGRAGLAAVDAGEPAAGVFELREAPRALARHRELRAERERLDELRAVRRAGLAGRGVAGERVGRRGDDERREERPAASGSAVVGRISAAAMTTPTDAAAATIAGSSTRGCRCCSSSTSLVKRVSRSVAPGSPGRPIRCDEALEERDPRVREPPSATSCDASRSPYRASARTSPSARTVTIPTSNASTGGCSAARVTSHPLVASTASPASVPSTPSATAATPGRRPNPRTGLASTPPPRNVSPAPPADSKEGLSLLDRGNARWIQASRAVAGRILAVAGRT